MIHSCLFKDAGEAALYLQCRWLETLTHKMWSWSKAFLSHSGFKEAAPLRSRIISATNRDGNPLPRCCSLLPERHLLSDMLVVPSGITANINIICSFQTAVGRMIMWLWTDQMGSLRHCKPTFLLFLPFSPGRKKEIGTYPIYQGNSGQWVQGQEEKSSLPEVPQWWVPPELTPIWIYSFHFCLAWQHLFPLSPLIWLKFLWHQSFNKLLLSLVLLIASLSKVEIFQLVIKRHLMYLVQNVGYLEGITWCSWNEKHVV